MDATAPVEVGTRGTVASLVMKEIEYFRRLELGRHGSSISSNSSSSSRKPQGHITDMETSSRTHPWPSFSFLVMTWRRKKRRSGGGVLPSMCSVVEVADSHRMNGIPGFNYRNLKEDAKKYEGGLTVFEPFVLDSGALLH